LSGSPLIGLPTLAIPPGPKPPRFGINQSYVRALVAAGCAPVLIPLLDDDERLRAYYDDLTRARVPRLGIDTRPVYPAGNLRHERAVASRAEVTIAPSEIAV